MLYRSYNVASESIVKYTAICAPTFPGSDLGQKSTPVLSIPCGSVRLQRLLATGMRFNGAHWAISARGRTRQRQPDQPEPLSETGIPAGHGSVREMPGPRATTPTVHLARPTTVLLHDGVVNPTAQFGEIIQPGGGNDLGQVDHDQIFYRVYPVSGMIGTTPTVLAN